MHHCAGEKRMIRLPQTHHPFAPDTSSVWAERIIRFFMVSTPFYLCDEKYFRNCVRSNVFTPFRSLTFSMPLN